MKRILSLLLIASAVIACQKETVDNPYQLDPPYTRSSGKLVDIIPDEGTVNEPINFFSKISFWDEWRYIGPLEERFAALEQPEYEGLVKDMTTLALIKTVVNYPQNTVLYSAWEDKFKVIDICVQYHAAFRELMARENAADMLIGAFVIAKVDPKFCNNASALQARVDWDPEVLEDLDKLNPGNEKALSYLMASDYFDFSKSIYFGSLIAATVSKINEWNARGYWTNVDPLYLIQEKYCNVAPSKSGDETE